MTPSRIPPEKGLCEGLLCEKAKTSFLGEIHGRDIRILQITPWAGLNGSKLPSFCPPVVSKLPPGANSAQSTGFELLPTFYAIFNKFVFHTSLL